ncbi:MAG: L-rhamnose mutarotase [Parvibaculum sp.]|nr:L-rhamnose mutarotase [Parvibaculum sp.]
MSKSHKRMGHVIAVRPEKIVEYKKLHAAAWPDVLAMIKSCHIDNYTIYLREPENLLFSHWEYSGDDFAADMARMAVHEPTQKWWALTDPCQQPMSSAPAGEKWSPLEEVFHVD